MSSEEKIVISIDAEIYKEIREKASKIILTLTERAIINQLDKFFSEKFNFSEGFLRSALIVIIREFHNQLDIPLQSIGSVNQESRFEKLMELRLFMNEFFIQGVQEHQSEVLDAINSYFSKYFS